MSEAEYIHAIENLVQKHKTELHEEENDDLSLDDYMNSLEDQTPNTQTFNALNLSELSFPQMDKFRVSRISAFEDSLWDWRQEGSPLYKDTCSFNWEKDWGGFSLGHRENRYLYRFLKMTAFYALPQNACLQKIRSFNSSKGYCMQLIYLARFLYKNRIFVDIQGNGSFSNTTYLTEDHFRDFLKDELQTSYHKFAFAKQVRNWRRLSQNKLIPVEYRLDFDPFTKESFGQLLNDVKEDKQSFMPIRLETLSELVSHCLILLENSEDIRKIYDILLPSINSKAIEEDESFDWYKTLNELPNVNRDIFDINDFKVLDYRDAVLRNVQRRKLIQAITTHPKWHFYKDKHKKIRTNYYHNRELLELASQLEIDLEKVDKLIIYNLIELRNEAVSLITDLRNACIVILFLVTGMRRSEMYLLEAGDCWHVKGSKDDYRIRVTVSKTSEASTGIPIELPIPELGYKAFKCWEALTEKARAYGKTNKLLVNLIMRFGTEMTANRITISISEWCENLGIEHIHPHQFRKTIAMFAIYQDSNNIALIRRLFSHKSLAMTLAYIVKMPGMTDEIKLAVMEQNIDLLAELLDAIEHGTIGGKGGNRIKKTLQESKITKANLHDDGWESIEQYVEVLLDGGINILHRTSFNAICLNLHSGLLHLGPEECKCNVVDCDWASFTSKSIDDLQNTIKFHRAFLVNPLSSDDQKSHSQRMIRDCNERLNELIGQDTVEKRNSDLIDTGV